jgi:hypothetical protein
MEDNYSIFRKFPTLEQANELKELFLESGIESILADNTPSVDITFFGNTLQTEVEIRLRQSDFKKAEVILEKNAEDLINQIDKDYYLFEFSDDELYDILVKSDEWSAFDYTLAQKLLKDRGKPVDDVLINSLKSKRLKDLSVPDGNQKYWIIGGYVFSILGGFLGLLIGYLIWTSKKTLPNGEKVYSHYENDRKHGKYIFYIGLIIAPIALFLKVSNLF